MMRLVCTFFVSYLRWYRRLSLQKSAKSIFAPL
jgi:hypothetical protein